jgi:hypothetical protein
MCRNGVAQEHGPGRCDDSGPTIECPKVQLAQVHRSPQGRVSGEQYLKAAVEHEAVGRQVGAQASTNGVGRLQHDYWPMRPRQQTRAVEASQPGAGHDDRRRIGHLSRR